MPRIAIAGFHHETNTFARKEAELDDFIKADGWPPLSEGKAIFKNLKNKNIPISGFIEQAKHYGFELEPLLWCNAPPSSFVSEEAYNTITRKLETMLEAVNGCIDALYLDLHGAMVAKSHPDGEGELLLRLRKIVGDLPIIVSLDLHANITHSMGKLADIMVGFTTYPHIDMAETGARAAHLLHRALKEGKLPAKAHEKMPFLIPITAQCTLTEPAHALYTYLKELEKEKGIWSTSFLMGFPPADITECGPSALVYADTQERAYEVLDTIVQWVLKHEEHFHSALWQPEAAVTHAMKNYYGKPVLLVDTQDNPGAGTPSDTTGLLRALVKAKAKGAVVASICDAEAVAKAHKAGKGKTIVLSLGEKSEGSASPPFEAECVVEALSKGKFKATGPFYAGSTMDLGNTALVSIDGVKVILISRKVQAADQAILTHLGINPKEQKILALKSSVHFRADFQSIAGEILIVEAPGMNIENPEHLPYRHLRPGVRLRPLGREHRK